MDNGLLPSTNVLFSLVGDFFERSEVENCERGKYRESLLGSVESVENKTDCCLASHCVTVWLYGPSIIDYWLDINSTLLFYHSMSFARMLCHRIYQKNVDNGVVWQNLGLHNWKTLAIFVENGAIAFSASFIPKYFMLPSWLIAQMYAITGAVSI